jgi:predicted DCC family thiol-disulfide oxidoreductase YuxK
VEAISLRSEEASRLLGGMTSNRQWESWHLVNSDGRVFSAGRAFAPLFDLLPGGAPLAFICRVIPKPVDIAYAFVASNRSSLGRLLGVGACRLRSRDT